MHTIARNGINSSVGSSGDGNAITGITVDNANNQISVTKATCFAVAKGNNTSCIDNAGRADKADALNVSAAVGSATTGVYISASGIPTQMTYTLGKSVTSTTCLFTGLGTGLCMDYDDLCINYASDVESNSNLPVTAAQVKAYVASELAKLQG